jgi:pimeloyl-ACP methyl ester carboxylesterase
MRSLQVILAVSLGCCGGETPAQPSPRPPSVAAASTEVSSAAQRHLVQADGHPLAVWSKQAASPRDAIVVVHGRTWSTRPDFDLQVPGEDRSLMDALVREGFVVYGVDLRGYGETPRDDSGWTSPDRAAADVHAVLSWVHERHPDLPPPALLGWSMGSLVSQLCAQRHPDALSDLILYGYPREPGAKHPPGPPVGTKPPRANTTAKAAAEDFIAPNVITKKAIDAFVAAALTSDPIRADWRALDELDALDPKKVSTPTLVIHGELDPYAPVSAQANLFEQLAHPDRTWVIVPGGDHAAHLEDTKDRFVQAVVTFIRRPRSQ